jgi:hypothetical protein
MGKGEVMAARTLHPNRSSQFPPAQTSTSCPSRGTSPRRWRGAPAPARACPFAGRACRGRGGSGRGGAAEDPRLLWASAALPGKGQGSPGEFENVLESVGEDVCFAISATRVRAEGRRRLVLPSQCGDRRESSTLRPGWPARALSPLGAHPIRAFLLFPLTNHFLELLPAVALCGQLLF